MSGVPHVSWTQLTPANSPLARSSHGVSIVGDTLYMFGGEHSARHPVNNTLYALDLGTPDSAWREVRVTGEIPSPRFGHAQAVMGESIYIFGGRMGVAVDEKLLNDLYMLNTRTFVWTKVDQKGTLPCPRSFHKMVSAGGKLYVFGGCPSEGRLADLHVFDPAGGAWSALESSTMEGRGGAGLVVDPEGSALHVVGGFAGREMRDMHRFDLLGGTWSNHQGEMSKAVSVALCAAVGQHVVHFGGELAPSSRGHAGAGNFSEEIIIFGKNMEEVVRQGGGAPARGWCAGDVWGGDTLVLVGGLAGDDENPDRLMDVWCAKIK